MSLIRRRETARVLLKAPSGRFLLLLTHWDPDSGLNPRWVTPGGGIEPQEDPARAAVREVFEETGLQLDYQSLGASLAELEFNQTWANGNYETGKSIIYLAKVAEEFSINKSNWTSEEHRDIVQVKWWEPRLLVEFGEPVGPPGLLELIVALGE